MRLLNYNQELYILVMFTPWREVVHFWSKYQYPNAPLTPGFYIKHFLSTEIIFFMNFAINLFINFVVIITIRSIFSL